jgi:GntR family transcriptional regulator
MPLPITRQTYADERVVEAAVDIVIPADRVELDYWIDLRHEVEMPA